MANPFHLVVDNVDKRFNTKQGEFIAIRDINLRVQRGEFTALIGHSGCVKSTLLNLIAGLNVATSGVRIVAEMKSTVIMVTHDVDEAVLLADKIVMMTNGPSATIGEILDVKLARPRDRLELAEDTDYHHYRKAVVEFLYSKQKKAA